MASTEQINKPRTVKKRFLKIAKQHVKCLTAFELNELNKHFPWRNK